MEAAIALFAMGGGAGAAAGAATSAAAWAAGTTITTAAGVTSSLGGLAAAGSGALSILQGVSTAASMLSTLAGGLSSFGEARTNAKLAQLQGEQEYIDAERRALAIRRETLQKTGSARVAFAASGLDISSADAVVNDLEQQGAYETGVERQAGQMRKLQSGLRARQYRASGGANLLGSVARAGGQAANFGLDIAQRG
ncbi:MAG: hypothetical protein ACRCS9_08760 [Hyphomicrobium sp.]